MSSLITVLLWWLLWFGTPWIKKPSRCWIRGILIVFFCFFASVSLYQYIINWYPRVHVRETTVLRVGPDVSYGTVGTVTQNDEVMVYSVHNKWRKIRKDKLVGWVPETAFSEFKEEM